jgi:hypothetical protein
MLHPIKRRPLLSRIQYALQTLAGRNDPVRQYLRELEDIAWEQEMIGT